MKALRLLAVVIIACASAFAWPSCSGQWVSVPAGTSSANGVIYSTGDLTFQCQKIPTTPAPTSTLATSTASSSATGGSATANGGSSTSKAGVTNSGNSSNTNNNTANQTQTQSNTSTNNNQSTAANNGNNSNDSVTNVAASKIPVTTAYAPSAFPSAPCVKGFGAGVQTMPIGGSFGGSKVDTGCDDRETARAYALLGSRLAACKTLVYGKRNQKVAKKHPEQAVTVDECMQQDEQQAQVVVPSVPQPTPVAPVAITVQSPPAQVVVLHEEMTVTATHAQVRAAQSVKPAAKKSVTKRTPKPCIVPNSLKQPLEK